MKTIEEQEGLMRNFKGHKALTEGPAVGALSGEAEGESRNLGAKCKYPRAKVNPRLWK